MVNEIASDSLSNSGHFGPYTISTHGEMKVFERLHFILSLFLQSYMFRLII